MAHCNTILSQMLKIVPRHVFASLDKVHGTGRKARKFNRWDQFVHLLAIQLTGRVSLRDGVRSMRSRLTNLYHLGTKPAARSTFAEANEKRPAAFFEALFGHVYGRCQPVAPKHKFKFKNKLFSLDATTVSLCLSLFPWAKFRKTKAGIKINTLLDHNGYLPAFVSISKARRHESKTAKSMRLPKGSIVVMDKAYFVFAWLFSLTGQGVFFVTRMKTNTRYKVVKRNNPNRRLGVTSDQTIWLTGPKWGDYPTALRRVGYRDKETGKHYVFLTNNFDLAARTIADIYKDRWQIETFFRFIKQNLMIKTFIGNSENAVLTQVYVALIAYLLLCYLKFLCRLGISLQQLAQLLQLNLFRRCTIQELFEPSSFHESLANDNSQLTMRFA